MVDQLFIVTRPTLAEGGWRFTVQGQQLQEHGPFESSAEACRFRQGLLAGFKRRARARGGWVSVILPERWLVVLPEGSPVVGLPFQGAWRRPPPDGSDARWAMR